MWRYSQSQGLLYYNDRFVAKGYSGRNTKQFKGRNNPTLENVPQIGPIPKGTYTIGLARLSQRLGPCVLDLEPTPLTNTFGRSLFRIHGNNSIDDASHGCIILQRAIRIQMDNSKDKVLEVVG